jgi:hypothetical protein
VGMLTIDSLAPNQKGVQTKCGGKAVLLKGSTFTAKLQVMSPAQQPTATGPVPDPMTQYTGTGMFVTTNVLVKGS